MQISHSTSSLQGKRPSMQDTFTVIENLSGYFFAGIYDGHGGSNSAKFAASKLHGLLVLNLKKHKPLEALSKTFVDLDKEIHQLKYDDGTTASVVLIKDSKLYLAHVGDSRVIIKQGEKISQLTKDHKITDPKELASYRSSNWFNTTSRLISKGKIKKFSLISISRSLGDRAFADAISPLPDVKELNIEGSEIIVMATDGVWDVIENQEIFAILDNATNKLSIANLLTKEATKRGSADNVTAICINLEN